MTAPRLNTQGVGDPTIGPTERPFLDFGNAFGGDVVACHDPLSDNDTSCPSAASDFTLHKGMLQRGRCHDFKSINADGHKYHPGPPFPVGEVILADVKEHGLQQAFVMES